MINTTTDIKSRLDSRKYRSEAETLSELIDLAGLDAGARSAIADAGAGLVRDIRASADPGMMEVFLAEYGLSTEEGIALMCLAEALLRVPDPETVDALIEDKIAPSDWGKHLGHSSSSLVNASTWALMLTGKVLEEQEPGVVGTLRNMVKRMGEPVIRNAVGRAMREMGRQFVLGESINSAMIRAAKLEKNGYTYSYDMLGEAARTDADAKRYHLSYSRAISAIAGACKSKDIRENPGISVKLSALHPRYEVAQRDRVMSELVPRVRSLALLAKSAGMGFNIDAEEADRLSLSLEVIKAVLEDGALHSWDGFGVVVQAYGQRAGDTIDWLYALAQETDSRFMVRLVKGAYWDTEVKHAQVMGVDGFPVFTRKASTDVSYIANARKLLGMTDRIYPQFATHNAHTVAAILHMADDPSAYEFQRLHGMGERLHDIVMEQHKTRCRIYAPVGEHRDLLAYLVRRLLENGANSSFVNQIVDDDVPPEQVASDPFAEVETWLDTPLNPAIKLGPDLFPGRRNSVGWDLTDAQDLSAYDAARAPFANVQFKAAPLTATSPQGGEVRPVTNPANPSEQVGTVQLASAEDVETALANATPWDADVKTRGEVLNGVADLYEKNAGQIFAILAREAGKSPLDAVAELREAVDFLRYYADQAQSIHAAPVGVFTCISPWNFPLAIFTGQIAAALATGNAVLSKPAEATPLIAHFAVTLMHEAGVPKSAMQLLPGAGSVVGRALTSDPRVGGVAFTGSTTTAKSIRRVMADTLDPGAPLIAETGGLNAMIVDSTALPEQAVQAIVESAFQSAGQRCSALRCLYVQEDIAENFQTMLFGAMDELRVDAPWSIATDVGPVIDTRAQDDICNYVDQAHAEGRVLKELSAPNTGHYVAPAALRVDGINDMKREVFGPILHIATFGAEDIDKVIAEINATGYGLTFGLQTRIDGRVEDVVQALNVGNIYVNRNQIGAIVGSQPFGGEGLSGTGPKAGGPHYLHRFTRNTGPVPNMALAPLDLPGPTGESNRLTLHPRLPVLCMGPGDAKIVEQTTMIEALGGHAIPADSPSAEQLGMRDGISAAIWWGNTDQARAYAKSLAKRDGPILPLITGHPDRGHAVYERHVCIDTTAAGGNAALLAEVSET